MFRCEKCNTITAPGVKANKLVVQTRPKNYFEQVVVVDQEGNSIVQNGKLQGSGLETVREINACYGCANEV